jgi:hypothetical protein
MSNWSAIEIALRQHASVGDCVVLDSENSQTGNSRLAGSNKQGNNRKSKLKTRKSSRRIVAYIVANQAVVATADELRKHIQRTLPNFMLPIKFVFRNTLSIKRNDRVGGAALMADNRGERDLSHGYVAPRTLNEKLMAQIWEEALKLKNIGAYDNFFDIVRDSSSAIEIISRVRRVFTVTVPLRSLFADPTVAGMTAVVLEQKAKWSRDPEVTDFLSDLSLPGREQVGHAPPWRK